MTRPNKVYENRLRLTARRHGFILTKSRVRDPGALGFGLYGLISVRTNGSIFEANCLGSPCTATLGEVEKWLKGGVTRKGKTP